MPNNAQTPMHRLAVGRGNRFYLASYAEVPTEELSKVLDETDTARFLEEANNSVIVSFKGKGATHSDIRMDGSYGIRSIAPIGKNALIRVESAIADGKLVVLVAIGPNVWKANPEFTRFFSSIKLKAEKPPVTSG